MTPHRASHADRRGRPLTWLALAGGVLGLVLLATGLLTQQPDAAVLERPIGSRQDTSQPTERRGADGAERADGSSDVSPARSVPLGPSRPVTISVPAIGVASEVFAIGKADDGTLAVPQPGPDLDKAAWFENSPTPGQPGPAIIEGHVATAENGPSIFYDLAELRPGDTVRVDREDGSTAVFEVRALREFAKDEFPTELVYGGDLSEPSLRLITCSNFDASVGSHTGNLVVFTTLSRVIKA